MRGEGLARAVAGHGLAPADTRYPGDPLPTDEWASGVRIVQEQRLTGLLAAAIGDGSLPVTVEQFEQAVEAQATVATVALALERLLFQVLDELARWGVEVRLLKGAALAHRYYHDPGMRAFGDIDLLVRGVDFETAGLALTGLQGRRRYPEPARGFDRRFGKGACFVLPDEAEVDLHRTLTAGPYGLLIDADHLFGPAAGVRIGDRTVPTLSPDRQFLHACYHAVLGGPEPRLLALRDVAELARSPAVDVDAALQLAEVWQGIEVVARAVTTAWRRLQPADSPEIVAWAESFVPTARQGRRLALYTGSGRSTARQALAGVAVVPGVYRRSAYLRSVLLPRVLVGDRRHRDRWRDGIRAVGRRGRALRSSGPGP